MKPPSNVVGTDLYNFVICLQKMVNTCVRLHTQPRVHLTICHGDQPVIHTRVVHVKIMWYPPRASRVPPLGWLSVQASTAPRCWPMWFLHTRYIRTMLYILGCVAKYQRWCIACVSSWICRHACFESPQRLCEVNRRLCCQQAVGSAMLCWRFNTSILGLQVNYS